MKPPIFKRLLKWRSRFEDSDTKNSSSSSTSESSSSIDFSRGKNVMAPPAQGTRSDPIDLTSDSEADHVDLTANPNKARSRPPTPGVFAFKPNSGYTHNGPAPGAPANRYDTGYGFAAPPQTQYDPQGWDMLGENPYASSYHASKPPIPTPYTSPTTKLLEPPRMHPAGIVKQFLADEEMARALQEEEYGNSGPYGEVEHAGPENAFYGGQQYGSYNPYVEFALGPTKFQYGGVTDLQDNRRYTYDNTSTPDTEPMGFDTPAVNQPDPTNAELDQLQQLRGFVKGFSDIECAGCHQKSFLTARDVLLMTKTWINGSKVICGIPCSSNFCFAMTCPSCKGIIEPKATESNGLTCKVSGRDVYFQFCCDGGREFALWALACGWEERNIGKKPSTYAHGRPPTIHHSLRQSVAQGTGYGGDGNFHFSHLFPTRRQKHPLREIRPPCRDTKQDQVHEAYFRYLAALLPSHDRPSEFDISPPDSIASITRSPLFERAAIMLSNDSIQDISQQFQLYNGMLDFVHNLANHTSTAGLVCNERQVYSKQGLLLPVSFTVKNDRVAARDTGKSLRDLIIRQATPCRAMLQHARNNESEFSEQEASNMLYWSKRITQIADAYNVLSESKGKQRANASSIDLCEYHRSHVVQDIDDAHILRNFAFADVAQSAAKVAQPPRGRIKKLAMENANLQASLPEGIYVRYGSSRLDVMKILIIGPKDTPYEYGFFEFDLYCGLEYPSVPPMLHFKTTGSGRVGFNPNLYSNGKVCLSLLGTWEGEPWRPAKSTILQVLVSIQSMIFCDRPWYNEPGRERFPDKAASDKYNEKLRRDTLQHAILPWIGAQNTIWDDVVQTHLKASAKDIILSYRSKPLERSIVTPLPSSSAGKPMLLNASRLLNDRQRKYEKRKEDLERKGSKFRLWVHEKKSH